MDMLQIVDKPCVTVASNRDVYLKYEHMGGSYHGLDHYNAVVKVKPSPPAITPSIPSTSNTNTNPTNIDSSSSSDDTMKILLRLMILITTHLSSLQMKLIQHSNVPKNFMILWVW